MMLSEDLDDDDYVASLLKQDARASSTRVAAASFLGGASQRPVAAPKLNTRFLRNIIRETDSHNAALLAKEAEDSKAKLRAFKDGLRHQSNGSRAQKRWRTEKDNHDYSSNYRGSRKEGEEGFGKRTRTVEADASLERTRGSRHDLDEDSRSSERHHPHKRSKHSAERSRKARRDYSPENHSRGNDSEQHSRSRRRSTSPPHSRDQDRKRRRHRSRTRSPDKNRHRHRHQHRSKDRSHRDHSKDHDPRPSHRSSLKPRHRSRTASPRPSSRHPHSASHRHASPTPSPPSSDPLDAIVGPHPASPPPVISKGRNAYKSTSAMDAHFSSSYNPSTDVQASALSDEDDWDQALEALRDRQRWKTAGAERLRAAGFTEEEVRKWERGGEKREEDVKWKKKGEGREWDRGKVVDGEGEVGVGLEWGRSKGN